MTKTMNTNEIKAVEKIKESYTEKTATKFDELRKLDKRVKRPATVFAYVFGTVGSPVLCTGMCLAMKVIGDMMITVIGIVGIAMVSMTYPIYKKILSARRAKYSAEILALTGELLDEKQ